MTQEKETGRWLEPAFWTILVAIAFALAIDAGWLDPLGRFFHHLMTYGHR